MKFKAILAIAVLLVLPVLSHAEEVILPLEKILPDYESKISPARRSELGVMRPDRATREEWQELSLTGPSTYIDPSLRMETEKTASVNLLSHLQYTPSQRNQGSCGDCWAWAGTGCIAIALSQQEGIKDRLSVQLLNSCYSTTYACCGGWAEYVANFYNPKGYCVPWSNTNASFQDAARNCAMGSSLVSCGSIASSPSYTIDSISASYIITKGVSQATAIANIKNVLNQGKAVWFAFYAPTQTASNVFHNFWDNNAENQYLGNFLDGSSCGQTWDPTYGWGHAILCYGYYDDGGANRVWYMLNSWGTTANRPNGTLLVDMDMNYSCQYYDSGWWYNYYWAAYDITFSSPSSDYRVLAGGDYNGDNYDDIAIFRPSTGLWSVRGLTRVYFGGSSDTPVPGDYNGNGTTNMAIFRPSTGMWAVRDYPTAGSTGRAYFGGSSDTAVPADYNGNGTTQIAVFRPSTGMWARDGMARTYFGASSDKPVPGDYSGDGTDQISIFRESSGLWAGPTAGRAYFGTVGDIPVPGDYANTGDWAAAIFRPSTGMWAVLGLSRWYFGGSSDQPVPADYNQFWGDDIAIFRPSSGLWGIRGYTRAYYGSSGDIPVTR